MGSHRAFILPACLTCLGSVLGTLPYRYACKAGDDHDPSGPVLGVEEVESGQGDHQKWSDGTETVSTCVLACVSLGIWAGAKYNFHDRERSLVACREMASVQTHPGVLGLEALPSALSEGCRPLLPGRGSLLVPQTLATLCSGRCY